jgi:predicted RNase H-like HicB family nuclease
MQTIRTYHIELRKEPEGSYTAIVPSLPGCITWGETVEHTLEMAKDAIEGYIAVLIDEGEPIPE